MGKDCVSHERERSVSIHGPTAATLEECVAGCWQALGLNVYL